jgi:SAM-dependent methyltransferase
LTSSTPLRTRIPKGRKRKKWSWSEYYEKTAKSAASDTLTEALRLTEADSSELRERFAIDLGCGVGRDTFELLRRGWKVLAIDNQPIATRWIRSNVAMQYRPSLRTRTGSFITTHLPKCDLLNASCSLPFCSPKHFASLWRKIVTSIRPGGRFSGHFFGVHDEWASLADMTFHSRGQVKLLLRNFKIERLQEKEWEGTTASGRKKHWHVFSVVARKL